jgi:multiple sugar transport system permease protein
MLFATPAAYALSRFRFRNRNLAMIGLLAFQMISPLVIMVPLYRYMDRLGMTDSLLAAGFIYIAVAAPLFTWMLKGFLDGIPQSLEEAAMIDGCTRFGAFMRVVLPLSLPGLTSAFVLNAILGWSQFIIPFILISKPSLLPISVGIFNFQGTYNQTSTQILAAASVLSIVPAVVVFLVLQRFIIGALMAGAVKG